MQKEEEKNYVWALTKFSKIVGIETYPLVIVTNRKLTLINAIKLIFRSIINLLCIWHIEKNIYSQLQVTL